MIYKIFSLVLLLSFYSSYMIKNLSLVIKKIKVNQLGKNKEKENNIRNFEIFLKYITIIMFIVQLLSIIIDDNWLIINVPPFIKVLGLCLMLLSNIIFIMSIITMKENWRVGITSDNTDLVINGLYKFSRNPAFLSFDLLYLGLLFVYPNPINLLMTILLIKFFDIQIKYEEENLRKKFKERYIEYCNKVGRYFINF